jgi:hypothetical protein
MIWTTNQGLGITRACVSTEAEVQLAVLSLTISFRRPYDKNKVHRTELIFTGKQSKKIPIIINLSQVSDDPVDVSHRGIPFATGILYTMCQPIY